MKNFLVPSLLLVAALGWTAESGAPSPVVKSSGEIDFHASGSLPPGAEYHLIYEDPKTHAVQTIVRMPRGYALPPHSHSFDETMYVVKGKLVLDLGGKESTLGVGSYAVLPAGTVFAMKAAGFGGAEFIATFNGPFDVKLAAPAKPAP